MSLEQGLLASSLFEIPSKVFKEFEYFSQIKITVVILIVYISSLHPYKIENLFQKLFKREMKMVSNDQLTTHSNRRIW